MLTAATLYQRLFLLLFIFSLIIATVSTRDDHDLHGTKQERDIAQLTRKLQSVTKEKEESQEIITTLQTKLQEYKQQLLKNTG